MIVVSIETLQELKGTWERRIACIFYSIFAYFLGNGILSPACINKVDPYCGVVC